MGLRYLLVKQGGSRFPAKSRNRMIAFVIFAEEELRLRAALKERSRNYKVMLSGDLGENIQSDQSFLTRWMPEIDSLAVTTKPLGSFQMASLLCQAHLQGIRVVDLETSLLEIDPSVPANSDHLIRILAQKALHQNRQRRTYTILKNIVEPLLGALLLAILSPVLMIVMIAVKLTSRGPIFYSQERVGLGGEPFQIYKFRSMRVDAEKNGAEWASAQVNDSRLTPIGGFLRASHLDEIPQLWNVLKGEVSFIGPRPERPIFVEKISQEIPLFHLRTMVKPGITGWAQIRQGYANSISDSKRKLEFDLFYILKHSFWIDVMTVVGTLWILATGGTEGKKRERMLSPRATGKDTGGVRGISADSKIG